MEFASPRGRGADWHELVGRAGFAAKAVVYGLVGAIAIAVAVGGEEDTKGQSGALRELAGGSFGQVLLVALAVGLAAYAIYRLVEVFVGSATKHGDEDKLERAASVVRFLIYAGLSVTAIRILADSGGSGGSGGPSQTTSTVFDLPAGVALVFVAGLVVIGVGIYQGYRAFSRDFEDDLDVGRMGEGTRRIATPLGVAGHAARAVVFALIGAFLIKAAVEHDSREAIGLDGALREISQQDYGTVLLLAVAVGVFLYGAYTLIEARYRRL